MGLYAAVWCAIFQTYWWFEHHMDGTWGFALMEGRPWTAPVWVSEFGAAARSDFWLKAMRYFSARDVDWAYWVYNPKKQVNKELDGGQWVDVPLRWDDDTYGIL